jgi:hypothetical protein
MIITVYKTVFIYSTIKIHKIMKTTKMKAILLSGSIVILSGAFFVSCSKSSSGNSGPVIVVPTNPGGYDSAAQIQPSALKAYFSFNGTFNDSKSGLVASTSSTAPTFGTGVKGQGYQGNGSSYLVVPLGSAANTFAGSAFASFTVSLWINEPVEPIYATNGNYTPGQGPEGVLFMYDAAGHQDLLHMDIEPFAQATQDTMSLNAGLTASGLTVTGPYVSNGTEGAVPNGRLDTAIKKWTAVVMTYDAASSNYTLYENGTAVFANSAWSTWAAGPTPAQILTGGLTSGPGSAPVAGAIPLGTLNFTPAPTGFVIGAWCGTANVGGFTPNQYSGSFKGIMDELRIYNVAMSASDVKSLYILEKAGL